ncbi:hypothetical protein AGABI1DRAFT_74569 [Agaricus bisporus var. burnettii JB137-S8]|uniref:Uncharacterized protein n=1 Tax=Agaricus bisporus var. burnettii (strain JB137-S8 / ATCC MYA-4627 / FGSC 10392) TaxID=597362 RepID=K5X8Z1_AGABU|nr:uncharacterized protein AGABI1DRAFT_74569 [Agaricus bisporus var. burnettii JB137-S8]EKM79492.1 hypothetical protein AGABI1DRAFT_74569 [Agaricus bisporus var. burnettii JB137-S8]
MTSTRERVRGLLKPLLRTRPRTPFWNIPAHTRPTRILYRNLLKHAPTDAIYWRIQLFWKENKHLTSIEETRRALHQGYKYLDIFQRARQGDERMRALLQRYSNLINARCKKEYWQYLARKELVWRAKLRFRPIVTGAYFPPSVFHKPLPRMVNQPTKLSQMIRWRYEVVERRVQRQQAYIETINDIKADCRAEEALQDRVPTLRGKGLFGGHEQDWTTPYKRELDSIQAAYDRGNLRAQTPFPQSLLTQLKQARRERILNKTKERLRELRGEQTPSLLKKLRQGPPARILKNMSSRQRYLDKVARHPSEVGMVARAKRELRRGMKNTKAYLVEDSLDKKKELDAIAEEIRRGNLKRGAGMRITD